MSKRKNPAKFDYVNGPESYTPPEQDGQQVQPKQSGQRREAQPQAMGQAAAFDRWIAQGGGLKSRTNNGNTGAMKYRTGPMAGKTEDQAKQIFLQKWGSAPESVREKYAARSRSGATKSEVSEAKMVSGGNPLPEKITNTTLNAGKKPAPKQAATPAQVVAPSQAASDFADLTKAPVAPGGEAQSVGNGATAANGYQAQINTGTGGMFQTKFTNDIGAKSEVASQQVKATQAAAFKAIADQAVKDREETNQSRKAVGLTPIGEAPSVAPTPAADVPAQAPAVMAPPAPAVQPVAPAAQVVGPPRSAMPAPEMAGAQASVSVTPPQAPAVVAPSARATPSTTQPAPQVVGPPRPQAQAPELTGQRVMRGEVPKGVNSLTGLPKGYLPGDNVSGMSQQIQQRAGESIQRQEQASASAAQVVAPIRKPLFTSAARK